MLAAPVGDDGLEGDPTVRHLEERVAALLQKEGALFVPSGTMANQLAIMTQTRRGDEVLVHAESHVFNHEMGAGPALSGVTLRPLASEDGSLGLGSLEDCLVAAESYAPIGLITFENTHNRCGGVVVSQEHILQVAAMAHRRRVRLHLDGARLWNAAVQSRRSAGELAAPFDTVAVCLSKGLGCPVGSLLVGRRETVALARRYRRMLGGTMRQAGVLAAAGLFALDRNLERLAEDHRRAQLLAAALEDLDAIRVQPVAARTNIVFFDLDPLHPLACGQGSRCLTDLLAERGVLIARSGRSFRAVTHLQVDDDGLDRAMSALQAVLAESQ
jgi:threonine aldolase